MIYSFRYKRVIFSTVKSLLVQLLAYTRQPSIFFPELWGYYFVQLLFDNYNVNKSLIQRFILLTNALICVLAKA